MLEHMTERLNALRTLGELDALSAEVFYYIRDFPESELHSSVWEDRVWAKVRHIVIHGCN